ncbi:MAG: ATP-binding protein [Lewinellaceae bacterium]|nr:ATP-binding protein [Phaeodactylibacter sp.]MCB9037007.1 ATP-binding protein [Lewinellaceae bacterium]
MKYPVGIQDFWKIRKEGYTYVDKTQYLHRIVTRGDYFFLSRPRRFGKSLLLSTLKELYAGQQELFKGLWIEKHWNWEQSNPVIWLRFSQIDYQNKGLYEGLSEEVEKIAGQLNLRLKTRTVKDRFRELVETAKEQYQRKVVLLIDEYDKPIIDYMDDVEQAEANREVLKNFYSILKDSDPNLELVFITGVSAFSKVSIFSDLNNLKNLSLHRDAAILLGITSEEVERYFMPSLRELADEKGLDVEMLYEEVKRWYNGYSWDGIQKVYNPFSLLSFLDSGAFYNFWFETGTPTFLVKEMKKRHYYDVQKIRVSQSKLSAFDFTRLDPITVLFQTGYLTITAYMPEDYLFTLDYPNLEVQSSLEQNLLRDYLEYPTEDPLARVASIRNALRKGDLEETISIINSVFASIPYDLWQKENEHFYHALVHLTFSLLGIYVQSEAHTAKGRCDALVHTENYIYAFEFKLDKSAEEALKQIRERGYLTPFADAPQEKLAVGVNFSTADKQVEGYLAERY